jgi:hypothetical protein
MTNILVNSGNDITRREIMRILPEIKSKTQFRNLCKRLFIFPIGERRERHVNTFIYSLDVVERLRAELKNGDLRKRGWL